VKSVEGVELLRTQLVLEIEQVHSGDHTGSPMVADIELVADGGSRNQALALVILESLVIRRDIAADATTARLLGCWWKMGKDSTGSSGGAKFSAKKGVIRGIEKEQRRFGGNLSDLFTITTTSATCQSRQFACGWHGNCAWGVHRRTGWC